MNDDDFFWEGVDQGHLFVQKCASCDAIRHPPAPMCGHCHSTTWVPQELSGRGTVFAWLISSHPTESDAAARTIILVDMAEGVRMISNLLGGGPAEIGMPVELTFADVNGQRLPQFFQVQEPTNASA